MVLQTVHTHHGQHFRVVGPLETRDVFPLVKQLCVEQDRGIEKAFTFLYIIHFHHHPRVILAGLGVLILVVLGVEGSPHLHVVFLHLAFVEAHIGNLLRVGAPFETLCDGKLLLVHPVGGAVDDFVPLAVFGDGVLFEGGEVHPVEVVVAHKRHLRAVGAEGGQALLAVLAYLGESLCLDVIDIIIAHAAVAVQGFEARAEQYLLLVGAELVAFESHARTLEQAHVALLLAAGIAVFGNARAAHGAVVLAVGHRADAVDALSAECPLGPDVLQRDALRTLGGLALAIFRLGTGHTNAHSHCKCHKYN